MTTQLILAGEIELAFNPDTAADFEQLCELIDPEDYEDCRIDGDWLVLHIDHDVPNSHLGAVHAAVNDFVNKHSKAGGALRFGDRDDDFGVYGRTFEERREAHRRYCDDRANDWFNARDSYKED